MDLRDTAKLLAKAQLVDNRNVDQMTITAWAELLQGVSLDEALWALNWHRARTTEWLQPAHILAGVRECRKQQAVEGSRQRAIAATKALEAGHSYRQPPPQEFSEWFHGLKEQNAAQRRLEDFGAGLGKLP